MLSKNLSEVTHHKMNFIVDNFKRDAESMGMETSIKEGTEKILTELSHRQINGNIMLGMAREVIDRAREMDMMYKKSKLKKIPKTLRTTRTEAAYQKHLKETKGKKVQLHYNPLVWEDDNYIIVKNNFPYDRIARENDILLYKDWGRQGLDSMLSRAKNVINELWYDFFLFNADSGQSVPDTPHLHLIKRI